MRVKNKKKMFNIIKDITSGFKHKEITFISIDEKNNIDCNLFSRHIANICYENRKKVLLIKEDCDNFKQYESMINRMMFVKHEYFDELEIEEEMEFCSIVEHAEFLKNIYTDYDLVIYYAEDIFKVLEKYLSEEHLSLESQVIFLFKRKNIRQKDLSQVSEKIKNLNLNNFHILKI